MYIGNTDKLASEILREHVAAKQAAEQEKLRTKMSRAYSLVQDMVERGLVINDSYAKEASVSEIMDLDDKGFEQLKRVVAQSLPVSQVKTAGYIPQVGVREPAVVASEHEMLKDKYERLFQPKTRR
jgi:hypothetical protein